MMHHIIAGDFHVFCGDQWLEEFYKAMKEQMTKQFPYDINKRQVKIGDKIVGFGELRFHDGWSVNREAEVTANIQNGVLYFGNLSASSFDRFLILDK